MAYLFTERTWTKRSIGAHMALKRATSTVCGTQISSTTSSLICAPRTVVLTIAEIMNWNTCVGCSTTWNLYIRVLAICVLISTYISAFTAIHMQRVHIVCYCLEKIKAGVYIFLDKESMKSLFESFDDYR